MSSNGGDVRIICVNGCMEIGGHMPWERAKHKAAQAGWMESGDGEPLCPLCAPALGLWPLGQAPEDVKRARARRHRARQLRARIVEVAAEYKEAWAQHEAAYAALMRADELACEWEREQEERLWEAREVREALFALLGELEGLEGERA